MGHRFAHAAAAAVLLAASHAGAQAPPNDDCAAPTPIAAIPSTLSVVVTEATDAASDPVPWCRASATLATTWWSLDVAADQQVRIDTTNSTTNTTLSVWKGECGALVPVDCDWTYGTGGTWTHGMVDFFAEAGVTYRVAVGNDFAPDPGAEVVLDVSPGQCGPIELRLTDTVTGAPVVSGHAQLRDLTGGWYLIREGWTDASGVLDLHPIFPSGDLDLQVSAPGHVVAQRTVTLGSSPQVVDVALEPLGPAPVPSDEPTHLVVAVEGGLLTLLPDGSDRRLIHVPGADDPTWSPDGARIAFTAPGQVPGNTWPQLFVVGADGSGLTQLTDDAGGGYPENLDWSPTGSILFHERSGSTFAVDMDAPSATPVAIWSGQEPSACPDGSQFVTPDGQGLRIVRFDGADVPSTVASLCTDVGYSPAWSLDGSSIAFSDGVFGAMSLAVVDVNGLGRRAVLAAPRGAFEVPAWSPTGEEIAFLDRTADGRYLEVVGIDGAGRRRILEESVGLNTTLDWAVATPGDVAGDAAPRATLLAPCGGERVAPGDVVTIRWTASDDHGIASCDLVLWDGTTESTIAAGLPGGDRAFAWTVPDTPALAVATVRVVVHDTVGQVAGDTSAYPFTIAGPADPWLSVRLLQPAGGEFLQGPSTFQVAWEAGSGGALEPFSLDLSTDGGFTWTSVATGIPDTDRTLAWDVPAAPVSERAFLRVRAGSWPAETWSRSGAFALNVATPAVPGLHLTKEAGGVVTIDWTPGDGAISYDVIRGNLFAVRRLPDRIDLGAVACVADDAVDLSVSDATQPAPGEAFFWLVRVNDGVAPGSYGQAADGRPLVPASGDCP